jgi:hypothetical protein
MTDRFDAQLRQHLLGTANERPADDQLTTIVELVARNSQRRSIVGGLTWWPGRLGPIPIAALRYGLVAAAVIGALVAALLFAGGGGPGRSAAFEGTWTAIDSPDGSTLTLVVGTGATPAVHFEDDFATGAACVDDAIKVFTADGMGEIAGSRLVVTYPDGGGCGSAVVPLGGTIFDYQADTDTIVCDDGFVWSRVRGDVATIPPAPDSPATPSSVFEGTWTATDVPDGSTLTLVVGTGDSPTVHFEDAFATGDVCVDAEVKVFTADGIGTISGGRLEGAFPDGGGCGTAVSGIGLLYTYRADTDTMVDQDGVIWSRVDEDLPSGSEPPATPAPASSARPSQAPATGDPSQFPAFVPLPSYTCDLLDGTYGGHFGSTLVTVATPTTWHGLDDVFHAEDEGCGGGAGVRIEVTVASEVYADTCNWLRRGVEARSPAAATTAFSEQSLFDVTGPVDTELGGYPARRYDFILPADLDLSSCSSSTLQFWRDPARDKHFGPTLADAGSVTVYFVEVDDVTYGVYVYKGAADSTPEMRADLDAVVESLRFEP